MQQIFFDMVNFKNKETGEYLTFPTLKGDKGDTGKSAYASAVELGFTGTEAEWVESLKYVSSPEYDTLLASLNLKEANASESATAAAESAQAAEEYYNLISGLKGFEIVQLEEGEYTAEGIPSIAEPKESTFYLVPTGEDGSNQNTEFIWVNGAWEMIGAKPVDLTPYALASSLSDYALASSLNDYALKTDLDDYATLASLDDYATTESLNSYATTESLNDYATIASLEDYATKEDLKDYTTTTDLSTNYALKSELVTADEKTAWNAKYDLPEAGIPEESLSTEVRVKLNSFFEADPVDKDLLDAYALKTELLDYQPKTDMKDYAKTEALNNYALASSLNDYATVASLDDYVKTEELDDLVDLSALEDYALKTDLEDLVESSTLDDYALKTELSTAEQRAAWSAKYDKPEDGIPLTDLSEDVQAVINDPKIEVDNTLTIEGAAADAKTTGDILATKVGPEEIVKFIQWDNAVDGMTMSTTSNMVIMKEDEYEKLKVKLPNTFYFIYDDDEEAEAYDL